MASRWDPHWKRMDDLRKKYPGLSDDAINASLKRTDLEWEIADIEDLSDVKRVLNTLLDLALPPEL